MNKPNNKITNEDVADFVMAMNPAITGYINALDNYQEVAVKSAIYPGKGTPFGLMYCALGLGEAGGIQNKVKKAFRDDGAVNFVAEREDGELTGVVSTVFNEITDERKQQIIKEMGGNLWYLAAMCDELGVTLSEVATANLDELCGRGQRGTLSGDGDDR